MIDQRRQAAGEPFRDAVGHHGELDPSALRLVAEHAAKRIVMAMQTIHHLVQGVQRSSARCSRSACASSSPARTASG